MPQLREADRWINGVSFSPGRACTYSIPERWVIHGRTTGKRSEVPKVISAEERERRNTGRVISRYWQAVGWLWIRSRREVIDLGNGRKLRHRQGFLTLTLPGVATGDHMAIKAKILDPFWTYCRNVLGLRDYVWTAELQERGEIHFHAIVNQFLPKDKVRAAWLRMCDASGIIQRSGGGSRPATEIEECRDWNGSRIYAGKYLAKALRSGDIVGRVWSGSHSVTGIPSISTNEAEQAFDAPAALREVAQARPVWRQHDHGISTCRYDVARITRRSSPVLYRLFRQHLHNVDNPSTANDLPRHYANVRAHGSDQPSPHVASNVDRNSTGRVQVDRTFPKHQRGVAIGGAVARRGMDQSQQVRDTCGAGRQGALWNLDPERRDSGFCDLPTN